MQDTVLVNRELLSQPHKNKKLNFSQNTTWLISEKTVAGEKVEISSANVCGGAKHFTVI